MKRIHPNLPIIIFLSMLFILNLLQSAQMSLSHDEAYYWIYSIFPSWGYYDHPPMVSWLIGFGTVFGKNELFLRLPFALLQILTLALLWDLAGRKNFVVFSLSALSMPLIVGSGFLALPDTPLLFFSTLFWWLTLKYEKDEKHWHVLLLGFTIACMFYSKYHALVVVILTTLSMPKILTRRSFWLIVGFVVFLYLPHVLWQYENEFITFDFHLNKRSEKHFDIANIIDFVGGQLALGGLLAFIYGIYKVLKTKATEHKTLMFNSIGFMAFVFLLSFRNKVEANWTVTAFAAFIPLLCFSINSRLEKNIYATLISIPMVILIVFRFGLMSTETYDFLPNRVSEVKYWEEKSDLIVSAAKGGKLVADTYQIASKLSFYTNELVPSLALGSRESQFKLLNLEKSLSANDLVSYVSDENFPGSTRIDVGYGGPLYVLPLLSFEELLKMYNRTYEETIRN